MLENKTVPFSFVKAGVFYFTRRVPKDLDHHNTTEKIRSGYGQDQRRSQSTERKELLSNSMNTGTTYASKT
ncbi:hypothetical protein [Ruegeria arenilitoris]|uniref:hypothetical protein n=1 Tax=Ruegeria arenilitoris TaxID=1173585 RepID=UPI001480C234|nr:hypothetical protein [Ruegeria arenilitoris]